jgi:hypothetical protein
MSREHLATYLNDHLAGANLALELLDHFITEDSAEASILVPLRKEIEEDRQALKALMATVGVAESRLRKAGSWFAGQLSEAKFNVDDDLNGPMRRFERLEALSIGIEGKLALWRALDEARGQNAALSSLDYEKLRQRASNQRSRVEALRLQAAGTALAIT